jgi:hypothetical protein
VRGVIEGLRVGIGGRGWASAWGEDEFDGGWVAGGAVLIVRALSDEDVAGGSIEEGGEDFGRRVGAVVAEDVLLGDRASDFHAGEA